jgi:hypothetical protein
MKFKLLFLFFFIFLNEINAQSILNKYGYFSGICSGDLYLCDNSYFYYERGCENRSNLTIGKYYYRNDTLILQPLKLDEINLVVDIIIDSNSNYLACNYVNNLLDTVEAYAKYVSLNTAKKREKKKYNEIEIFDDTNLINTDVHSQYFKKTIDKIAVCPIELQKLTTQNLYYILPEKATSISIKLNLPKEILQKMIQYNMIYKELNGTDLNFGSLKVLIE